MRARSLAVIVLLAAPMMAGPASAAPMTYVWSTAPTGAVNDSGSITFGSNDSANEKAKIPAYQISSLSPGSSFSAATFARYPGGVGVASPNEASQSPTRPSGGRASPLQGRYEFVVAELDNAGIAWTQNEADAPISAGSAVADFTFSGSDANCGAPCDFTELGLLGHGPAKTFPAVTLNATRPVAAALVGRRP